jgi:hypothetical protein
MGGTDLSSRYSSAPFIGKKRRENIKDVTEAPKEEMRTEEAQQAGEEFVSNRKGSRHFKFWRNKVCKMGSYEMLSLFVIFVLVLSAMLGGLTALMVIALRMGGHLNNIERTLSPVEERASQWRRLSLSRRTLQAATTTAAGAPR